MLEEVITKAELCDATCSCLQVPRWIQSLETTHWHFSFEESGSFGLTMTVVMKRTEARRVAVMSEVAETLYRVSTWFCAA